MRIAWGAANLALQFTVAGGINGRERGASVGESLRISDTTRGAKNAEELIAFAANASEEAEFLENHGPGDDGEHQQKQQNSAGDPAGLRKNVSDIGDEKRGEQKNDVPLSERR